MPQTSSPRFHDTVASVLLDAVRGVAALMVCAYHWRFLFFVDYSQLPSHRALWFLPYMLTSLGHQAVMVFFVLSGYLVGGSVFRSLDRGKWSWGEYLLHRVVRLWVVLVPALVIGGLIDGIALHRHLAPVLYAGLVPNHITYNVSAQYSVKMLLGSLFFVQEILTLPFGSNGPLWSLAYEFWYYMLFPLLLLVFRGPYTMAQRALSGVASVALCCFVGPHILWMFAVWQGGILIALLPSPRVGSWVRWTAFSVYCPFFLFFSRGDPAGLFLRDCVLGFGTFFLLWILLSARQPVGNAWYVRPSRGLAGFSYTLYLLHMPMLMFLVGSLAGEQRWLPTFPHVAVAGGILCAVIGVAYPVSKVTEARTAEVRDWVARRLGSNAEAVPAGARSQMQGK